MGKQGVYESAVPPDQAFDTLIPCKLGFRRKDKHVCGLCKEARAGWLGQRLAAR